MSDLWAVVFEGESGIAYGPMSGPEAELFAKWLTAEVDPARPVNLNSPTREMLGWWIHEKERNNCTHVAGCPEHPQASGEHDPRDGVNRYLLRGR